MKLIVVDTKTNIEVELNNKETFNNIDLNHKLSVEYMDKNNKSNKIERIVRSIEHKINMWMEQKNLYKNILICKYLK